MSAHFNDETKRYGTGDLREVYYHRPELDKHTERKFRPEN
jgi:acyl-homoserine-lactone acylase